MGQRLAALTDWLKGLDQLGEFRVAPASDDASFRRYFRITTADGHSLIAMDAPPEREDVGPFLRVAEAFARFGIHVPQVHAADPAQGFVLLSDLGAVQYLDVLDAGNVERHYGDALGALVSIQACGPQDDLPHYDRDLLWREMELFRDWLLQKHLGLELSAADNAMLDQCFNQLIDNALEQPQVCVHRDYHSRNLMVSTPNPGVLDFQDAVLGPVTYDLASLLRDCYIAWPRDQVKHWVQGYFELALQSGVVRPEHEDRFLRWFDLMGAQRHLKAAGIFARLNLRDGKPGYLKDIPRTLGYIVEIAPEYAELAELAVFIQRRVLSGL
ncbi:MAG: phosphotransferase [Gammaproteobacteria bacterium]|nr:phosphotransferase [Gammaproteobacteria bacterium]